MNQIEKIRNISLQFIHFGDSRYLDYTKWIKYGPEIANKRRDLYLKRSTKMLGNWKDNPFSANNLSINLLWNIL